MSIREPRSQLPKKGESTKHAGKDDDSMLRSLWGFSQEVFTAHGSYEDVKALELASHCLSSASCGTIFFCARPFVRRSPYLPAGND